MVARSANEPGKMALYCRIEVYVVPPSARGWVHAYSVTASMLNRPALNHTGLQGAQSGYRHSALRSVWGREAVCR